MKKINHFIFIAILCLPFAAGAHATPLESTPAASSRVAEIPQEVVVRFSERLDQGASVIKVQNQNGEEVSSGPSVVSTEDARILAVPVKGIETGAYFVTWSVVSSDDGHFTRGSFPFVIGDGALPQTSAADFEIVQISTTPEAFAMTIELVGNGILWAALIIFAFAIRPVLRSGNYANVSHSARRGYALFLTLGALFAIGGACLQIVIKSSELSALHDIGLYEALWMYASTTAGSATIVRMASILCVSLVGAFSIRKITQSTVYTWNEVLMVLGLAVFALARAMVSHATANPFLPELSVVVNTIHLIEKDVWAGTLLILVAIVMLRRFEPLLSPLISRVYSILSANLVLIVLTASYIVWLHLKSFENLFSTKWGTAFLQLFVAALLLVILRVYHMAAKAWRPRLFSNLLPFSTAAEFGVSLLVLYFSSLVIITSPPLPLTHGPVFSTESEGVSIEMALSPYEGDAILLTLVGGTPHVPDIEIVHGESGVLSVSPEMRFDGGYVFPSALLAGESGAIVRVRAAQDAAYDAHAEFVVPANAYKNAGEKRSLDTFTIVFICVALLGALGAVALSRATRTDKHVPPIGKHVFLFPYAVAGLFCAVFFGVSMTMLVASPRISNPYRALCESDGNMWHLMLPMKAGVPVSETPREGCMWGMGNFPYMFPDRREYEYVRGFVAAQASISFESSTLAAGVPQAFTVSIKNPDDSPVRLFVDMEKLVHVVIVSADQTVFAHIHPDDFRTLAQEEIDSSTFRLSYTFPKGGEYLVSIDYANGVTLESYQQKIVVQGLGQSEEPILYTSPTQIDGYDIALSYPQPFAGTVSTFRYEIRKGGSFAALEPYLSAAMHIAVVKNDFDAFIHTHGEYHPPGSVIPPVIVRDGKIIHSMVAMYTPGEFSGPLDAHVIFPEPGLYTVWAQFKSDGDVHAVPFTVRVE